jgi:hypothetical protein
LRRRGGYDNSRTFQDPLEGRYKVKVHRIDPRSNSNAIFGKHADFSSTIFEELIRKGREEPSS